MYLRRLKEKDANYMLDWMHDKDVVENMAADFMHMKMEDCLHFIKKSNDDESVTLNRAICTDDDEYLGTISLKNISSIDSNAEYAIVLKQGAIGSGAARFATIEILKLAFNELKLHKVYLYVRSSNIRAQKFYNKIGFRNEGIFLDHVKNKSGNFENLIWLALLENEFADLLINESGR